MKTRLHFRPTLPFVVCLLAIITGGVQAANEDRWFRVELLVFSHETGKVDETWEPTPILAYPDAVRFLIEPDRVAANQAEYAAESTLDEYGRQFLTFPVEEIGQLPVEAGSGDVPAPDTPPVPGIDSPDADAGVDPPRRPTPFLALPASQREFRGKAAYMQRTGRYNTLFHQVWLQPVADSARSLPLVLDRSGDTGEWPLLQGSVTLYLSRYLHLETNLWLNTSGDYLSGEWRMPAPPLGPPSLIVEEPPAEEAEETMGERWLEPQVSSAEFDAGDVSEDTELVQEPLYPYRHAVLLQQKRRMRSNEVHYLDHPLIGLVVKLTPLSEEDLELLQEAEVSGDYPPLQP